FSFTLKFPLASVTVAVSVEMPAGLTVGGEAVSCIRTGGPGTKSMTILVRNPCTSAVTKAVPATVLAVKNTCEIPLVSVLTVTLPVLSALVVGVWSGWSVVRRSRLAPTTDDGESIPAFVAKVTGRPDTPAPDAFVTCMRSGMVLWPSATIAVDPDGEERVRWRALLLPGEVSVPPPPEVLQPLWRTNRPKHRTRKT